MYGRITGKGARCLPDTYPTMYGRITGLVPEFVNPKYADEDKIKFKSPTRLECMMQDYPKLLLPTANVGCVYR